MKKFLLILLATILILLPSCTTIPDEPLSPSDTDSSEQNCPIVPDDSGSEADTGTSPVTPSDNNGYETEADCLRDIIENPKNSSGFGFYEVEGNLGNIEVSGLYFDRYRAKYKLPDGLKDGLDEKNRDPKNVIIYEEKELFPESDKDNAYILFAFMESSDCIYSVELRSASLEGKELSIEMDKIDQMVGDTAFTTYFVMLTVKGSSIKEEASSFEIKLERKMTDDLFQSVFNNSPRQSIDISSVDSDIAIESVEIIKDIPVSHTAVTYYLTEDRTNDGINLSILRQNSAYFNSEADSKYDYIVINITSAEFDTEINALSSAKIDGVFSKEFTMTLSATQNDTPADIRKCDLVIIKLESESLTAIEGGRLEYTAKIIFE